MAGTKFPQRKLSLLLLHPRRKALSQKGSAMLLALILTMAILPAAGTLAYIARRDLESALDDYHRIRALYAAQGAIAWIEADLQNDGDGQIIWPDQSTTLDIFIQKKTESWTIAVTAHCGSSVAKAAEAIPKPSGDEEDPELS